MDNRTVRPGRGEGPLEIAIACEACGASMFPDSGALVCPDCTRYAPAAEPAPSAALAERDAAYRRVEKLILWYATRYVRRCAFGRCGVTVEEFAAEAALCFFRKWHTYDGVHLQTFTLWAVKGAAAHLRKLYPRPLVSLDDHRTVAGEGDFLTAPAPAPGPDPDDVARALAAVAALPARWREEVEKRFGLNGHRPHRLRELAGGATDRAASQRIRAAVRHLGTAVRAAGPR